MIISTRQPRFTLNLFSIQLIFPKNSPSSHEVYWGRWKSLNIDCRKASVQGVKNYITDSLLYQDSLEINENPQPEEPDSGNEADIEPEAEEECLCELNPFVTSINKLDINNTANDAGEWYINEELDVAYLSVFASILCRQILVPM